MAVHSIASGDAAVGVLGVAHGDAAIGVYGRSALGKAGYFDGIVEIRADSWVDRPHLRLAETRVDDYARLEFQSGKVTDFTLSSLLNLYPGQSASADLLQTSNVVRQAMDRNPFVFQDADFSPRDNIATPSELPLLIVLNYPGGAARPAGRVSSPNSSVEWDGWVAIQMDTSGTETSCHELCHVLGADEELYGIGGAGEQQLNNNLTLMSMGLCHLDPWNKMQFDWCDPVIRTIRDGGVQVLPAASLKRSTAPLLLYDPARGPQEYLLLDYRTPAFGDCEVSVPGEGNQCLRSV